MSGPAEPTGLYANHGVTEASGKVSHAECAAPEQLLREYIPRDCTPT
jgi:hypothetical protein